MICGELEHRIPHKFKSGAHAPLHCCYCFFELLSGHSKAVIRDKFCCVSFSQLIFVTLSYVFNKPPHNLLAQDDYFLLSMELHLDQNRWRKI